MDNRFYESAIENFTMHFPLVADQMISWMPRGKYGITVELSDGSHIAYNANMNTIRNVVPYNRTEESWKREFSIRLVEQMDISNCDQRYLSEISGVSEASISGYIHRKKIPNGFIISKLASALNCDASVLIDF